MLGLARSIAVRKLVPASSRPFHSSIFWGAKSLRPFLLADIGEGITECEVLKWSVQPNSTVSIFDPLCEVQSDKASVEITSPFEGTVKELLVKEGDIAKVGQGLCIIEVEDTSEASGSPNVGTPLGPDSGHDAKESPVPQHTSPVQDSPSPSTPVPEAPLMQRRPHPLDPSHSTPTKSQHSSAEPSSSSTHFAPAKNTLAAPSVRHFARKISIDDLSILLPGSGKDGRIEMKDVESYLSRRNQPQPYNHAARGATTPQEIELGRTRLAMYRAMTKSLEIPHFGYSATLDLTALDSLLPAMNAHIPPAFNPLPPSKYPPAVSPNAIFPEPPVPERPDASRQYTRLTFLPLLIKTLSCAMIEWPIFRTTITTGTEQSNKPTLSLRPNADISVALSTPTGLYTPTIQGVDRMNAYEIIGELKRLQHLGRQVPSGLTVKEMPKAGGTVTVSNVGAIGKGEWAHPLLVPGGGVAIVAIGRAKWVTRELESEPGVQQRRLEVGVSWSADHRIIEGAEMAAFVECWRAWVEQPGRLIAGGR